MYDRSKTVMTVVAESLSRLFIGCNLAGAEWLEQSNHHHFAQFPDLAKLNVRPEHLHVRQNGENYGNLNVACIASASRLGVTTYGRPHVINLVSRTYGLAFTLHAAHHGVPL